MRIIGLYKQQTLTPCSNGKQEENPGYINFTREKEDKHKIHVH